LNSVVAELRSYLPGWRAYFHLDETRWTFQHLDRWIRRRLRMVQLKQWKRPATVFRELRGRGLSRYTAAQAAGHCKRWWSMARHPALNTALPNSFFDGMGVPRLAS
jgi:hypothetical protein